MTTASSSHLNVGTGKPRITSIKLFRSIIKTNRLSVFEIFWPLSSRSRNAKTSSLPSARFHASYQLRDPLVSSTKRSLSDPYVAMFKQYWFSLPFLETLASVSSTSPTWPLRAPFLQFFIFTPKKVVNLNLRTWVKNCAGWAEIVHLNSFWCSFLLFKKFSDDSVFRKLVGLDVGRHVHWLSITTSECNYICGITMSILY